MKIQYTVGISSFTQIYDLEKDNIIDQQLNLSFPIITAAKVISNKNNHFKNIYVGKSIALENRSLNYWLEKYDLSIEDIADISLQGYKKACLLNYKKYDQIVVGINETDEIVPDYYALRQRIKEMKEG